MNETWNVKDFDYPVDHGLMQIFQRFEKFV